MQSVLSERFENRFINLDQYAAQQADLVAAREKAINDGEEPPSG